MVGAGRHDIDRGLLPAGEVLVGGEAVRRCAVDKLLEAMSERLGHAVRERHAGLVHPRRAGVHGLLGHADLAGCLLLAPGALHEPQETGAHPVLLLPRERFRAGHALPGIARWPPLSPPPPTVPTAAHESDASSHHGPTSSDDGRASTHAVRASTHEARPSPHEARPSPHEAPTLAPRGPTLTPRGPTLTPRGPALAPRGPGRSRRCPALGPLDETYDRAIFYP